MGSIEIIRYTGHVIVAEDGGDYGAIAFTGFATDEEAVEWAAARFPKGTWHYARQADWRNTP